MLLKKVCFGAVIATSLVSVLTGCLEQKKAPATQQPARLTEVDVQVLSLEDVTLHTQLNGRTSAYRVAEVRPQVSGIILKRQFEEGSLVKEGQSLYQIDPAVYEASVKSARAALAQAKAAYALRKANATRSANLRKVDAVSAQADDVAQTEFQAASANVMAAEAALTSAEINLRYTKVRSPIAGQVSISEVTPGALVTANQPARLTVVQQLDPIYVDVTQSYDDLRRLQDGIASGKIRVSDKGNAMVRLEGYSQPGTLTFKDAMVEEATGTVRLRALFPNPERKLLPGQFVRAELVDGVREKMILVPQKAVMRRQIGTPFVYVVNKENKIESRDIHVIATEGQAWVVDKGLSQSERLVVNGLQHVRPGMPVAARDVTKAAK